MKHLIKAAALVSIVASFSVLSTPQKLTPQKILFGSCGHQVCKANLAYQVLAHINNDSLRK
ncbi:hypothetical protein [Pseudoalteromonas arctica]|uniref:Uncharacterized protein n=1 Tax=Pseudoalteromonas arctica TaxID=394751 RepID=A0A7Y0HD22_9GAMM|nr:hypothetical protein [Pseudoalteromonas arctica]NMM41482.1 hypothetical protein [Pseudoalteromonas arctica]